MQTIIDRYETGVLGLPENGHFIPITNSEVGGLKCLRSWWFSYVEGLKRPMTGGAIHRGASWDLITEDMYLWWEVADKSYPESALDSCVWCDGIGVSRSAGELFTSNCEHCRGTGDGSMVRAMQPWWDALETDPPPFGHDTVEEEEERLRRAFRGYVERYEAAPLQHFKIVGVQTKLARVVLNPSTGKPYRPVSFIVKTEAGWVRAGTAAFEVAKAGGGEVKRVNWPVYQIGAMDAIARDRSNGQGWVIDAKYTGVINSFTERLQIDPQLPGYCWLLDSHLEHFGLTGVAGMMYDLTSSRMHGSPYELKWKPPLVGEMKVQAIEAGHEVKGLKGSDLMALLGITPGHGGFSTSESKRQGVPSWRFREAIEREGYVEEGDYAEAIEWCEQEVDPRLYSRPWRAFPDSELSRYAHEVYGKARTTVGHHRAATRVTKPSDLDVLYPRTPICAMPGGSCPFKGPCSADSPEAREQFTQRALVVWDPESKVVDNPQTDLADELGF